MTVVENSLFTTLSLSSLVSFRDPTLSWGRGSGDYWALPWLCWVSNLDFWVYKWMIIPLDSAISLASIKACMTLCYFIGLFRIKLLTWHNQESTQWSPDPFPCEKAASEHETISSYDSPAASWPYNLEGEARLGDCLVLLPAQSLLSSSSVLRLALQHQFLLPPSLFSSLSLCWYRSSLDR